MSAPVLHFYMPPWLFDHADRADTIFGRVKQAAQLAGWEFVLHSENDPPAKGGYHLLYNRPVTRPNTLVLRKCAFDPFFRIERTNDRWDWHVANATFVTHKGGEWFRKYWQGELFKGVDILSGGYVFMPLQGRLLQQRHFQTCSPIKMIEAALQADPNLPIIATLHPRQDYEKSEMDVLAAIETASGGQFQIRQSSSLALLAGCKYVVTQNSTMALLGMFARKPPILFAEIDFHHIAGSVPHIGLKAAYEQRNTPRKWGAYLHWYFKENAVNCRDDGSAAALVARMADLGWPISVRQ